MNNADTSNFIRSFFDRLEQQNIMYCILRGYSGLPEIAGRDIDVFIQADDNVRETIGTIIEALEWQYKIIRDEDGFLTYICTCCLNDIVSVIQIDFWTSLNWRGVQWCDGNQILSDLRNIKGFYVASEGVEAAITALKEVVSGKKVKEKYYHSIQYMANTGKEKFISCISPVFGSYAETLWGYCATGDFETLNQAASKIRRKLIAKNILCYLVFSMQRVLKKIKNYIFPQGKLIAFVGPDGSGKTTIMERMVEYLSPFFSAKKTYHMRYNILPELRTGHGFSSMGGKITGAEKEMKNETAKVKRSLLSKLASWFVVIYYTLEFFLGNFIVSKLRRKNVLVLYDRYYYDHFVQPTTRDLIYPFRKLLLKFVRKPDIVIHLNADAKIVYARKQELSMKEIEKQNEYIERILSEVKNAYSIDTDEKSVNRVAREVFEKIYQAMEK